MQDENIADKCADPTQELTIRIPCVLAERLAAYATEHEAPLSGVIVEALDFFLRHRPHA